MFGGAIFRKASASAGTSGWLARILLSALLLACVAPATTVAAQVPTSAPAARLSPPFAQQESGGAGSPAFLIEAAGGIGGSLLGFTIIYATSDDCPVEDLGCHLESAFAAIALGTGLSALGTYLAGRAGDTQPSGLGASLGAIVGAAAGLGAWYVFTEQLDVVNNRLPAMIVYSVTQGTFSALGSRLVRSLR